MLEYFLVTNHMDRSLKLLPHAGSPICQLSYSKIIGSFMYAVTCTRIDMAFAVEKLSRFTCNP